jgi:hypothetical protein
MEFFLNSPPPINGCLIKGSDLKKLFLFAKETLGVLIVKGEKAIMVNTHDEKAIVVKCKSSKKPCAVFLSYFFDNIEGYLDEIHDSELYAINFEREGYEGHLTVEEALSGKVIFIVSGKFIE